MLKPIDPSKAVQQQREPLPLEAVNNVFKVLHGFYGNLFFSKWATGQVGENGEDAGVVSARQIWAFGLRKFDGQAVKGALSQCLERHPEYPPSLPQFVALCVANQVRKVFKTENLIGMSQELRSQYARRAREVIAKHEARVMHRKTGYVEVPQTLDGLKQCIANAVAAAGGDEAAKLRELDLMLAPRAMA